MTISTSVLQEHTIPAFLARNVTTALDCPGGMYCEGEGNSAPTGNCTAGWYCTGGADKTNTTTHGGECQPGYFCPEGIWIDII